MNRGKSICNQLKAVRRRIAEENGIPLEIEECTYKGECRGTCPRCEAEVQFLESSLADRLRLGKAATVAGMALALAACGGGARQPQVEAPAVGDEPPEPRGAADAVDTASTLVPMPDAPCVNMAEMNDATVGLMVAEADTSAVPLPDLPDSSALAETPALQEGDDELLEGEEEIIMGAFAESDPEFPGGIEALYQFLSDNIVYPQRTKELGITGKVYVAFTVEKDGTVSNPRLLRDIGGGCGEEALRVVRMMPKWKPGTQRNKPVRVQYNLPVSFTIGDGPSDNLTPKKIEQAPVGESEDTAVRAAIRRRNVNRNIPGAMTAGVQVILGGTPASYGTPPSEMLMYEEGKDSHNGQQ